MESYMDHEQHTLINQLLKGTARSFYLTLRALPKSIRWPLSLAYLLARATDTIADEYELATSYRLTFLADMQKLINHGSLNEELSFNRWISQFKDTSMNFLLLSNFQRIIVFLYELDTETRQNIISVLNQIIRGQLLDIKTFSQSKGMVCLKTSEELDQYTYYVAGSVGEFWTQICVRRIKNYSKKPIDQLNALAISFGKGLQLINILRDIPQDLQKERCYLPLEQLQQQKIILTDLIKNPSCIIPIVEYWWQKAFEHLTDGWNYMISINNRRIRYAMTLPLLIGFRTLEELKNKKYLQCSSITKISRRSMKWLMLIACIGIISKKGLNFYLVLLLKTNVKKPET